MSRIESLSGAHGAYQSRVLDFSAGAEPCVGALPPHFRQHAVRGSLSATRMQQAVLNKADTTCSGGACSLSWAVGSNLGTCQNWV